MQQQTETTTKDEQVTDKVITVANVITFIRLCMAPVSLGVLLSGHDIAATALFALTAATDFLDGQIARRTNTVSRVGQLLDPTVDRLLMICAVVGLLVLGRLPLWVVVLVLARDLFLLVGGAILFKRYGIRVSVIYAGKFATTFMFIGAAGLMLNMPLVAGLGWCDFAWLPGFNSMSSSWGIWFIYLGLCLGVVTTVYYVSKAYAELKKALNRAA